MIRISFIQITCEMQSVLELWVKFSDCVTQQKYWTRKKFPIQFRPKIVKRSYLGMYLLSLVVHIYVIKFSAVR